MSTHQGLQTQRLQLRTHCGTRGTCQNSQQQQQPTTNTHPGGTLCQALCEALGCPTPAASLSLHVLETWACTCVVARSRPILCSPMDSSCSPPGSSVHGISQARILEWVAISSSTGSSPPWDLTRISCFGRREPLSHQGSPTKVPKSNVFNKGKHRLEKGIEIKINCLPNFF